MAGSIVYCGSLVALALAAGLAIEHLLHVQNVMLVFLPVILLAAVRYGFWTAAWVSVLSVLVTSFFFAEPRYSFAVSDPGNIWALAVFLAASGLTGSVAAQARQRAETVSYQNRMLEQLYAFTSYLAGESRRADLVAGIADRVGALLGADVVWLERRGSSSELAVVAAAPDGVGLTQAELAAAADPADRDSAATAWQFRHVRRKAGGRTVVLGIRMRERHERAGKSRLLDLLVDQIQTSLERVELAEEMQKAETLAESERLKTALLTSVSHDLRTPLASILGNVTSIRRYGQLYDDTTRAEMLEQAETETLRLSRFVDNLLQMSRLEADAVEPVMELNDPGDIVGSALKHMEKTLEGFDVRVDIDPTLPMLALDFVLMEHVLANLLDNAAKFSRPGTTIEVAAARRDGRAEICVRDQGPGFAPGDADRIFERFFRGRETDGRPAGAGLGLAICKGFVEAMGGTIEARNRGLNDGTSAGAEVVVTFPLEQPESQR